MIASYLPGGLPVTPVIIFQLVKKTMIASSRAPTFATAPSDFFMSSLICQLLAR